MNDFLKVNQQKIAIILGYTLVFLLAFFLGRITSYTPDPPDIKVEEPSSDFQANNNAKVQGLQSITSTTSVQMLTAQNGDCDGKVKGNISSQDKVYHIPGGAFYDRTSAEVCFNTEKEAQAAGFRKSSK